MLGSITVLIFLNWFTVDREDHAPYIEASQANMVYYVDDETDKE